MQIEAGKLYFKRKHGHSTVRSVVSIDGDTVHYRVVYGPAMKRQPTGSVPMKSFKKWTHAEYTGEEGEYHKLDGAKITETFVVQNVEGVPEFRCGLKRAKFYLRKGYAVEAGEGVIRLTSSVTVERFHQLYELLNPFFMAVKNDRCVCCGVDAPLTRHHVVPRRVLKSIPNKIKRRMSNILFVCVKCHTKYNENDITTDETDPRVWLSHFVKVMEPKYLPEGWDIFMMKDGILDENGDPPPLERAS